jgi:hypothetical protein
VEAHAVVDPVHPAVDGGDHVATLAVGIVDHSVEDGHPREARVVGVHQGIHPAAPVTGARHPAPAGWHLPARDEPEQRLILAPLIDPELAHARAERTVAQRRRRYDAEAGTARQQVRGDLAAGQRAVGEVPQRPLSAYRLVDAAGRHPVGGDDRAQRGVGGVHQAAFQLHLAVAQQGERVALGEDGRCRLGTVHGLRDHGYRR